MPPYGPGDWGITPAASDVSDRARAKAANKTKKDPGIPHNARIRLVGKNASPAQIDTINEILDVAESKDVAAKLGPRMGRAILTLVCMNLGESNYDKFIRNTSTQAAGIYQIMPANQKRWNPLALKSLTRIALVGGGFWKHGDINTAIKNHPDWPVEWVAAAVEGSYVIPDQGAAAMRVYGHRDIARAIIKAYGGVYTNGIPDTPNGDETVAQSFQFTRPYPASANPYQDSWACARALADEVGWALFAMGDRLYYFSEPRLAAQKPTIISRTDPELAPFIKRWHISRNNDVSAASAEFEVICDPTAFHAGECVQLDGFGGGDADRWIIAETQRSMFEESTRLTLKKAAYPQPEPAHDTTVRHNGSSEDEGADATVPSTDNLRQRIVAEARKTLTSKTNYSYYSMTTAPGTMTDDPMPGPGKRSDCSQWVRAIYLKAGASDPGSNTWDQVKNGKRTTKPGPGDLMMTSNTGHVELYVGNGKTIGHGSPPIDYATVDDFPGHYYVTFDFLDPGGDGGAPAYSKGSGRPD